MYFLLKPKENMKDKAKYWIGCFHFKLFFGILFLTPIGSLIIENKHYLIVYNISNQDSVNNINNNISFNFTFYEIL